MSPQCEKAVAALWSPLLQTRFPDVSHVLCRQQRRRVVDGSWVAVSPAECHDHHCLRCGEACVPAGIHRRDVV